VRRTTIAALLALAALTTLPGCVVSLFSSSEVGEETMERTESLERRMDRVEETMDQRSRT